jgi:hypothetical protein
MLLPTGRDLAERDLHAPVPRRLSEGGRAVRAGRDIHFRVLIKLEIAKWGHSYFR